MQFSEWHEWPKKPRKCYTKIKPGVHVFQARPDNYDEGWYQDENGDWLNQYDWHQDEYGEWYYEDSSYEDYDYSADGWYQDENGEWVQDTSLVQNNQTKLANGDVLPGT